MLDNKINPQDFINFCKELSEINFDTKGNLEKINETKMFSTIIRV